VETNRIGGGGGRTFAVNQERTMWLTQDFPHPDLSTSRGDCLYGSEVKFNKVIKGGPDPKYQWQAVESCMWDF